MILHIPHSKKLIPKEFLKYFLISEDQIEIELLKMTDHFTDELFDASEENCSKLIFPVSRILVDPERFIDDSQESMSKKGMGCVYKKTHDGKPLKDCGDDKRFLIEKFYIPHHQEFNLLVNERIKKENQSLIIDCHSFPKYPLPYETDQTKDRPEICIGTDDFHTPPELTEKMVSHFSKEGFSVETNRPFSGSIVPSEHFQVSENVRSIMIEVRRDLYMDEETGSKKQKFEELKEKIENILNEVGNSIN